MAGFNPEAQVEPVRGKALDDKPAAEGIEREQARQLHHDAARAIESRQTCERRLKRFLLAEGAASALATDGRTARRDHAERAYRTITPDSCPRPTLRRLQQPGNRATRQRTECRRNRSRQAVPGKDRRLVRSVTTFESAACSIDRNGPTSLPLGLITPTVPASTSSQRRGGRGEHQSRRRHEQRANDQHAAPAMRSARVVRASDTTVSPASVSVSSMPVCGSLRPMPTR